MILLIKCYTADVLGGKCTIKFNKVSILKEFTSNSFSRTQTTAGTIVLCCFLGDLILLIREEIQKSY
jgi:hypothetical protein